MKTAVIYARYSCDKQTEQSIEGQLRACQDYAKSHDIMILDTYIDEAMTGTNDNRPEFRRMLDDSKKRLWDYVLVYKLDRFSRNKYQAIINEKTLEDNGVKLLSAMEGIPDTPEGIILKSLLQGMNQYYSAELSQKVKRGMRETRLKGNYQGGGLLFGYKLDGRKIVIDEIDAQTVKFIYDQFVKGLCVREIVKRLTAKGIMRKGKPFPMNTVYNILRNEKYTGVYRHNDEIVENMYPAIIARETFEKVQTRLATYRHGKNSVEVTYLLRGKLRCGYCGQTLIGECGTSKKGKRSYYYKCRGRKAKLNDCHKAPVPKEMLENMVINATVEKLSDPENMQIIINGILAEQERLLKANTQLHALQKEKKQTEKAIENIMIAIEKGVITKSTTERLKSCEAKLEELERKILIENSKTVVKVTEKDIREHIDKALKSEPQMLVSLLVKEVVIYDDEIEIHYNSPFEVSPDNHCRGFAFYSETIRLNHSKMEVTLFIG